MSHLNFVLSHPTSDLFSQDPACGANSAKRLQELSSTFVKLSFWQPYWLSLVVNFINKFKCSIIMSIPRALNECCKSHD